MDLGGPLEEIIARVAPQLSAKERKRAGDFAFELQKRLAASGLNLGQIAIVLGFTVDQLLEQLNKQESVH